MSWNRFKEYYIENADLGFALDVSRMNFSNSFLTEMEGRMQLAFQAMSALEDGALANPDEVRMVGHYWLRNPRIAPKPELSEEITQTLDRIDTFAKQVHSGEIQGAGGKFTDLLVIGIGGSALGPQFVSQALGRPGEDRMQVHFFDNTDPDGFDLVLSNLRGKFDRTLVLVVSKSGGTPETRNGMLEAQQAYLSEAVNFAQHAVAITGQGSKLDKVADEEGWLDRFPMWDWVGGRTSEMAAVGLLPARLQGIDIRGMLDGATKMDEWTRQHETLKNPAAMLALMWYHATNGQGDKDMVILPYKDRLALFAKYLQQLVMESLGKEKDLSNNVVNQGIAVYGNKGSTDQHAYVQQLREGVNNFFATFIEVRKDREGASVDVEEGVTAGDYLNAFLLGTRAALAEKDRESITITVEEVTPETVGMLIALYERAVGFYASLVGINAYHQPGVEAGKKAAATFLRLKKRIMSHLQSNAGKAFTVDEIAASLGEEQEAETIFKLLEHLVANPAKGVTKQTAGSSWNAKYQLQA